MKKLFVLFISLVLLFSLFSCNNEVAKPNEPEQPGTEQPAIEIPNDFNYTPETDGGLITGFTPETAESIQKIMASVNKIAQGEDSQKLLIDVLTNVLSKGVTLRLPGNGSDTISIVSTGNYTPGKLTVNVNANVFDYQLGDSGVSANGSFIASVDIDIAKMNSHNPADYPYVPTFKIDPESTLTLTVKEKEKEKEYGLNSIASIEAFQKEINANNGENELSKKLLDALKNSYKQICVDVLKIAKEFLADDGYRIETDQYLISLKGNLDWNIVDKDDNITLPEGKMNIFNFFGSIFRIISVRDLTFEVSTKDVISLDDAGFELKLVGKVSNAYLSAALKKNLDNTYTPDDIIAVCNSADISLSIVTNGSIGENKIYAVGHFEGKTGFVHNYQSAYKTVYGYIRFNGEDYKVEDFFNNIGKMMSQGPSK